MCGILFQSNKRERVDKKEFHTAFDKMAWRGPDVKKVVELNNGFTFLGHHRLTVVDVSHEADQPMTSSNGRFTIIFNGEIYNHEELRKTLSLNCKTQSDTETILEGYSKIGDDIFELLDGMFSILIFNNENNQWVISRDSFGIKPLFIHKGTEKVLICSEASVISEIISDEFCKISLKEWEIIRRPIPGKTYFKSIEEVLPGSVIHSDGAEKKIWRWEQDGEVFNQEEFEFLLEQSIKRHLMGDFENVSLLSGGLDSAIITKVSGVKECYTVGLPENNEFQEALETSREIGIDLHKVSLDGQSMIDNWRKLTRMRGEPLSLPNEALIYHVCKNMKEKEKVVLTGEGADEILFGYDGIFRWAKNTKNVEGSDFISRYGYSEYLQSERLCDYVSDLKKGKSVIDMAEDFFYQVHLPGLLRRMDFASMAASKEARVPFVCKSLISYLYRKPASVKIDDESSKIPIRKYAKKLSLNSALQRKKIGFSAKVNPAETRKESYKVFHNTVKGELKW